MLSHLPFFPQSFPDETLHSRISRYHLLSGNRSEHATFRDLFDSSPFSLDVVIPKQIGQLVARLPGEMEETLQQLVFENTLLPLFIPFLGARLDTDAGDEGSLTTSLTRIPRRVVGVHGETKLCIRCTQDDTVKHGLSYWHRAHQVPGVTSCWVHGEKLLRACPDCSRPFSRKLKLLSILWSPCDCGWTPASETRRESGSEQEHSYARFSKELLHSHFPAIATEKLAACYRRQAITLGYKAGSLVSVASLTAGITETLGDDFLCSVDPAYAAGKRHQWIRMSAINGQLDMPITRHLILSFFLFREAELFKKKIIHEPHLHISRRRKSPSSAPVDDKRAPFRAKLLQAIKRWPDLTLEDLWKKAYTTTQWLFDHDKTWLEKTLRRSTRLAQSTEPLLHAKDREYAQLIEDQVEQLYVSVTLPERANIGRLLSLLPRRLPLEGVKREAVFPLLAAQIEKHRESLWHFHLRRVLWGVHEVKRLEMKPTLSSISAVTNLNSLRCQAIMEFLSWDVEEKVSEGINAQAELSKLAISRQWAGPGGNHPTYGGRSYQRVKDRADQNSGVQEAVI